MPDTEIEKIRDLKAPNIKMSVTLKEALDILKERTFHLPDSEIFHLVDKIFEYIYPTELDP